jgi:hypothetical protein
MKTPHLTLAVSLLLFSSYSAHGLKITSLSKLHAYETPITTTTDNQNGQSDSSNSGSG